MTLTADHAAPAHPRLSPADGHGEWTICDRCHVGRVRGTVPPRWLSPFEAVVLEAVATGASSVQIAGRLYLSRQAVDYHIKGMQRRLNAVNRAELVSKAYVSGLLEVGSWPPRVAPSLLQGEN